MLLAKYNTSTGAAAIRAGKDMFIPGKRPTLAQVSEVYGKETADDFLKAHIYTVIKQNAMTMAEETDENVMLRLSELADALYTECRHWMLSEIVVFFARLSNGDFGELTRTLTRQQIFSRLRQFNAHRLVMRRRIKDEMIDSDREKLSEICRRLYPKYKETHENNYNPDELNSLAIAEFERTYERKCLANF